MGFIYFFPPSQVAFRDSKTSPRPTSARVSWCLETSSIKTPFPGQISIPSSFVSLFIFYILPYLLSKTMGCFSGRLMTSASNQKLFCEVCSVFNCSFHEFVGEKGVSPSYSSAIFAPPPQKLAFKHESQCNLNFFFILYWSRVDYPGFPGGAVIKNLPANAGDADLIPRSRRSPGVGNGNILQYSCLENSMIRAAWQATVHGTAKCQTRLSN